MVAFLEQENLTQQYLGNLSHNIFHGLKTSCRNVALCLLCPLQQYNKKIATSDIMPGYTASHSVCKKTTNLRAKFYGKTEWRNTCEQITE